MGEGGAEAKAVESLYGEGSGPNKRSFVDSTPTLPSIKTQVPMQFEAGVDDRFKRKGQKKIGRRTEPMPLVGMFNDFIEKYDSPVSIREILQRNKVNISWMDLVAWFSTVCRELKRLCIRVVKKRALKQKSNQLTQQNQPANPFLSTMAQQPSLMPTVVPPPLQNVPLFQPRSRKWYPEKKSKPKGKQAPTPSKTLKPTIKVESKKQSEKSMNKKTSFSPKSKKSSRKKVKIELSDDDHERFLIKFELNSEAEKKNLNAELLMKALKHMQLYRKMTSNHDRKLRKLIKKILKLISLFEKFKKINNELILQQKKIKEKIKAAFS